MAHWGKLENRVIHCGVLFTNTYVRDVPVSDYLCNGKVLKLGDSSLNYPKSLSF